LLNHYRRVTGEEADVDDNDVEWTADAEDCRRKRKKAAVCLWQLFIGMHDPSHFLHRLLLENCVAIHTLCNN